MLITAHGGALGTGRNTPKYFETIKDYKVDAIEVDIHMRAGILYISHLPKLFYHKTLPLSFVFEYLKETPFLVNCDVKRTGLVAPVIKLASVYNVQDRLYFTGAISKKDLADATSGDIYLNAGFFSPVRVTAANLELIAEKISLLDCQNVKGLNLNYKSINNVFLDKAKELGLALSLYTVDDKDKLKELLTRKELANITTNRVDIALDYLNSDPLCT